MSIAAGDVNGDGIHDLVIGADGYDNGNGNAYQGRVFLFPGARGGLPASPAWFVDGTQAAEHFGKAIAVPDVNGDGFADIATGPPYHTNTPTNQPPAYPFSAPPPCPS